MTNLELVKKLQNIVDNYKTIYMWGVFGAPVNETIINQKVSQYPSWYTTARRNNLKSVLGKGYFAFDCVNIIKAVLWGWNGDRTKAYGGALYGSNGVPDISADTMIERCSNVSTNFSKIEIGEVVWLKGHIGVYIGGGKVIECTPSFTNGALVTACGNIGRISGLNTRTWTKHGKLPYITYVTESKKEEVVQEEKKEEPKPIVNNKTDEGGEKDMFKVGDLTVVNEKEYQKKAITKAIEKGIISGDGTKLDASAVITKGDFCVLMEKLGLV